MPPQRVGRRNRSKHPYKAAGGRRHRKAIEGTRRPGGPTILFRKLRYTGIKSLSLVSTGSGAHLWNATSLFDPDESGTGHQPRGFDQYMTMYDHYVVLGAKIKVEMVNNQSTAQGVICACTLQDDNVELTSLDDLMEYPKRQQRVTSGFGSSNKATFWQGYSAKKFFNKKPLTASELHGSSATNPSENAYFGVYAHTMDNSVGSGTVDMLVTIDYIVAFTEPKQPSKS